MFPLENHQKNFVASREQILYMHGLQTTEYKTKSLYILTGYLI